MFHVKHSYVESRPPNATCTPPALLRPLRLLRSRVLVRLSAAFHPFAFSPCISACPRLLVRELNPDSGTGNKSFRSHLR